MVVMGRIIEALHALNLDHDLTIVFCNLSYDSDIQIWLFFCLSQQIENLGLSVDIMKRIAVKCLNGRAGTEHGSTRPMARFYLEILAFEPRGPYCGPYCGPCCCYATGAGTSLSAVFCNLSCDPALDYQFFKIVLSVIFRCLRIAVEWCAICLNLYF